MKPSIIYCDLDGVLADFDRAYEEQFGLARKVVDHKSDQEFWEKITVFRVLTAGKVGWFDNLQPMTDYRKLWDYLQSLGIPVALLTATGMDRERAVKEKRTWILKYLGDGVVPLFVSSGKEKHRYATKTAILIDDTPKCIVPWRDAGGAGILHRNADDTIKELKIILEK